MKNLFILLALYLITGLQYVWSADVGVTSSFPLEEKCYTINRNGNALAYIKEGDDHILRTGGYDNTQKCYWQFIKTENPDCYYIKNVTSGMYMQSSKRGLSEAIPVGVLPVEFKVMVDQTQGAATKGYYYLCSTDQSINNQTDGTLGLNFGTDAVVAYYIKTGRGNSYWQIEETNYDYEGILFSSAKDFASEGLTNKYTLSLSDGRNLSVKGDTAVLEPKSAAKNQAWFFVGMSNSKEGYLIASYNQIGATLNITESGEYDVTRKEKPTRWYAKRIEKEGKNYFSFIPYDRKEEQEGHLKINGDSLFLLANYRSQYSLATQIYSLPCGLQGESYITSLTVSGEDVQEELRYSTETKPSTYHTLFTQDKAAVSVGCPFGLDMKLNKTASSLQTFVYFDWNADGVFETMVIYNDAMQITVPQNATLGKTRMRIRITTNGLQDAEDDVVGTVYDFVFRVVKPVIDRVVTVKSNAELRGTVLISDVNSGSTQLKTRYGTEVSVVAAPKGRAEFICWKNGTQIVSTDETYVFNVTEHVELTAFFSPNTALENSICPSTTTTRSFLYTLNCEAGVLRVITDAEVKSLEIYTNNGTLIRKAIQKEISVAGLPIETYIVKVRTVSGDSGKKIVIQ